MKSNCLHCNSEIEYNPSQKRGKFCNNKCQNEYQFIHTTVQRIEEGKVSHPLTLKRYLSRTRKYACEKCGLVDWNNNPIALHIDHIDGNSDNNLPSNLRLLCPNCHSQTETFCGRNFKNTKRSTYMKRYRIKKLNIE